jgi:hypothetical protein
MAYFIHLGGRWLNVEQIQEVYFATGDVARQPRCEVVFQGNYRVALEGDAAARLDEFLKRYEDRG